MENGRKQIDPENFTEYLLRSAQEEEIDARLTTLQLQESELEDERTAVRERRESAARLEVEVEHLDSRSEEIKEEIQRVERDLEAAQRDYDGVRHDGHLIHVLIYGFAAFVFVLADVVITRTIVADALELTGETFLWIDESWYFAVALALIAVLLKPAYDRYVEEPYWKGNGTSFKITIGVASVLSIVTLLVLGMFRSIAYEAFTRTDLQREAPNADPNETWNVLRDTQEMVAGSGWGKAAFILSGLLFAIAGAICLGISLRQFHQFRNVRRPARRRYKDLKSLERSLRAESDKVLTQIPDKRAALRRTQVWLENRHDLNQLEEQLGTVRDEKRELLDQRSSIRQERLSHLYADGYAMGKRLGDHPSPHSPEPPRKRARPYVAIRRAIRTSFSDIHTAP